MGKANVSGKGSGKKPSRPVIKTKSLKTFKRSSARGGPQTTMRRSGK